MSKQSFLALLPGVALSLSLLTFWHPVLLYLALIAWGTFAGALVWKHTLTIPCFRKYPQLIALNVALNVLPRLRPAHALLLDKTEQLVKSCILGAVPGLDQIGNLLFGGVRAIFIFAVIGIVYMLWQKRNDREDMQEWLRYLATLLIGAGIIGSFESFFLGNGASACSSGGGT